MATASSGNASGSSGNVLPPIQTSERPSIILTSNTPPPEEEVDDGAESTTESERAFYAGEKHKQEQFIVMKEDHKRYNASHVYNGLFIDFLVRARTNLRSAEHAKVLLDPPTKEGAIHRDGENVVKMEKLVATVSRLVTYHYKFMDNATFREVKDVKTHFWEIVEFKKQALHLNLKVDNFRLMVNLKNAKGREAKEGTQCRQNRLVDFWSKYHNTHRTIDLRLASTGGGHLPLGSGFGGQFYPRADDATSPKSARTIDRGFDPWKLRSSRGKHNFTAFRGVVDDNDVEPEDSPLSLASPKSSASPLARSQFEVTQLPSQSAAGSPTSNRSPASRKKTCKPGTVVARVYVHQDKAAPTGPVIPQKVKQALSSASIACLSQIPPAGYRAAGLAKSPSKSFSSFAKPMPRSMSSSAPNLPSTQKAMSSSTPNLPSMVDFSRGHPVEKHIPHRRNIGGGKADKDSLNDPVNIYLRACNDNFVLPNLLPFCTGGSDKFNAAGQALSDNDLTAMVELFGNVAAIEEVDLEGNASLTERSLVPLLQKLYGYSAQSRLQKLSLNRCLRTATGPGIRDVIDTVSSLLTNGLKKLQFLDLGGITIGIDNQLPCCEAISNHSILHTVGLSDVGLGRNPLVMKCLDSLVDSSTTTSLDIGWNSFSKAIFGHLGDRLCHSGLIRNLSVANCAAAARNGNNPVEYFLEHLSTPGSLTKLDISFNRIDFRGALVLEAALEKNMILSELCIAHNPLACLGFRSLLRLVARGTSGLLYFDCEDCWSGDMSQAAEENFQVFSASNPAGRYVFNLTRPYNRAFLSMLYQTCERLKMEPSSAFVRVQTLTSPNFSHPTKDVFGRLIMPTQGKVDITFNVEAHFESSFKDIADDNFAGFLDKFYSEMRVVPPTNKTVALFAQWKNIDGLVVDQIAMLDALSKDFRFTYPEFDQLCRSKPIIDEIAWRILPTIAGGNCTNYLAMLHMPSPGAYLKLYRRSARLLRFNIENPTGRYLLDLSNCCDFAIAERLLLLDRWECSVSKRLQLEDVSQRGIRCQVRNELYQGKALFGVASIAEFNVPEFGTLELDYVSSKRPPKDASEIGQETWDDILVALHHSKIDPSDQIEAITMVSHYFYINCLQMRSLTGIYRDVPIRCEFLVRLFMRLTDMHNEKIFRARFEDTEEFLKLQNRLGFATCFPFIQPEQATLRLDLAEHDQRLAFHMVLCIRNKEAQDNLRDYSYTLPDGTVDAFPGGIPRSWDLLDRIPKTGVFRASYNSAPEDRNYAERGRLMQRYGFWAPPPQEEVEWWSSTNSAPIDVVEFVEWIYTKYRNIWKVFKIIDGVDGNGQITLREFEEGIDEMKCKKFDGKDKLERIRNVFRYLDPSGEGQVSKGEWGVLEQLFREIQLSIKEFVDFCERTFGDNLDDAWAALDADQSGSIDEKEWEITCQALGFFGSLPPIFNFLDLDDEGTISLEEFHNLNIFMHAKLTRSDKRNDTTSSTSAMSPARSIGHLAGAATPKSAAASSP